MNDQNISDLEWLSATYKIFDHLQFLFVNKIVNFSHVLKALFTFWNWYPQLNKQISVTDFFFKLLFFISDIKYLMYLVDITYTNG